MSNYCQSKGIYCEFTTDLGFCSVTACNKENRVSNTFIIPTVFVTDTPMVEYAPVVRCKKCKYNGRCMLQGFIADNAVKPITDDWFCADGEKRNE